VKKALMYGAGNIGRGFIGKVFSDSGYEACFIDIDKNIISAFNKDHEYNVKIVADGFEKLDKVCNVYAVDRNTEDSYWSKIRKWANENLTDEMFQPLFSYYGRPSVSPIYTFTAMLIQLEKGYSDREMEEEIRFDDRVKYGITAQRDFDGIDAVTLCDHRKRFFESEIGTKILLDTINQAKEAGLFDEENLHVIDSFMVWGSCAKQDTYTMIYQGIKMVLKVMSFYEMGDEGRKVLKRTDYNEKNKKPKINWEDSEEKAKLLEELVKDALALVSYAKEQKPIKEDLKDAVNLLEKIALQDVDIDNDGHVTMKKGTA
jgi:transposase